MADAPNPWPEANETPDSAQPTDRQRPSRPKSEDRYGLHIILFLLTVVTACLVGAELISNKSWLALLFGGDTPEMQVAQLHLSDLFSGLPYALAFLGFLTFHEFGHYFTSRWHKVKASLPYYIPMWLPLPGINIVGSLGAVIRLRQTPSSRRALFDIGIAGPLAGFAFCVVLLIWGFTHLPQPEFLYGIHPEYVKDFGRLPTDAETIQAYAGTNSPDSPRGPLAASDGGLLFNFLQRTFADPSLLPNRFELIHYPLIWAGFLGLFFTALNLIPAGQLDGGHVMYGLFGQKRAFRIAQVTALSLMFYGGLGHLYFGAEGWQLKLGFYLLYLFFLFPRILRTQQWQPNLLAVAIFFAAQQGLQYLLLPIEPSYMWLLWATLLTVFVKLEHPPALDETPLDLRRKVLGWLCIVIFILCFAPNPIGFVYKPSADTILTHQLAPDK